MIAEDLQHISIKSLKSAGFVMDDIIFMIYPELNKPSGTQ